jgi:hypothetical protein
MCALLCGFGSHGVLALDLDRVPMTDGGLFCVNLIFAIL